MATVYNQTVATRFGVELNDLLANDYWSRFDVAVAWVRRSGLRHVVPALIEFLHRGGVIRFIVGIDIEKNTSKEGLEDLLALSQRRSNPDFHPAQRTSISCLPSQSLSVLER